MYFPERDVSCPIMPNSCQARPLGGSPMMGAAVKAPCAPERLRRVHNTREIFAVDLPRVSGVSATGAPGLC